MNGKNAEQITALLDSLVGALSTAIDERSPYNANHTRNMVRLGEAFLDWLERTGSPLQFDADTRRSFLMSIWLHDVGKLAVPREVMDKRSRLGGALREVEERFVRMGLLDRIAALEGSITAGEREARNKDRAAALELIRHINTAGSLTDGDLAAVDALGERRFTDENGESVPWLTEGELHCLRVRRGTLTDEERSVMQSHVLVTARILSQVRFPKNYARVPAWAAAHHELLNGRGYPEHKTADDIPWEVRLLTVLDVFEALTARDRPYKPPMPAQQALDILDGMVRDGALDGGIFELFKESRVWEKIL